ncbi:MAG: bifunctional UDP-sugar hydrolase/5'-nucleotidase [Acholeplasma sp.]|nr:bifunctional UDP-sugar hydrolase/5'-nucleotidase [Acholeplasma sp.]
MKTMLNKIVLTTVLIFSFILLYGCGVKHEVTFYVENEVYKSVLVTDGQQVEEIKGPEVSGKKFEYWLYEDEKYDFNYVISEDIALYAFYSNLTDKISDKLNIYYLNDTHGAILNNGEEMGMAKIANLINTNYDNNPNETIFIAGGDMFQGQLISNTNRGALMIEILNQMNLDAFVIGNHEFDWGIDEILKYFNSETTGVKANFPILGANIKLKSTNELPNFVKPYTIIEKNNLKIGIIGVIGDYLESDIFAPNVEDYYFSDAYEAVNKYANEINDQVDLILVVNHNSDKYDFNGKVAEIDKVAAVFNGHSHQAYYGKINNKVPYIQSKRNGERVGNIVLNFTNNGNQVSVVSSSVQNLREKDETLLRTGDQDIEKLINKYYLDIKYLYEDELLTANRNFTKNEISQYISKVMAEFTDSVAGFQNGGGTRMELDANKIIHASDLFQIFPFDNQIIYTEVTGKELKQLLNSSLINYLNIDKSKIVDTNKYRVATNNFVFFSTDEYLVFNNYFDDYSSAGDMYETLYEVVLALKASGEKYFNSDSPVIFKN